MTSSQFSLTESIRLFLLRPLCKVYQFTESGAIQGVCVNNKENGTVVWLVVYMVNRKKTHTEWSNKYSPFFTSSFLIRPTGSTKKQKQNYDQSDWWKISRIWCVHGKKAVTSSQGYFAGIRCVLEWKNATAHTVAVYLKDTLYTYIKI